MFAEIFGWAASLLTTLFAWPQAVRAWRATSSAGISLASVALMFQSGLLWTAYGILVASPYVAVANASVLAAAFATGMACRARMSPAARVAAMTGPVVVMALAALAGPGTTGVLGVLAAATMTLPQAALALRSTSSASLQALSPLTYVLLATNAACWIAYGIAIADPLVVAPNCITLPSAVLILLRRARPVTA
jgi:uncharacterized protein with PQ loop repeat